ncbi:L-rhamnose mutarotase [Roseovarius pacificus]|uniref:L-rhamnose mutarotase n=1 Tax=Roseovarius pacificus TaxID=337701 RepID=UPI002A1875A6|nr:L-rhamnose mutarotase [Roseovarius pacificus]
MRKVWMAVGSAMLLVLLAYSQVRAGNEAPVQRFGSVIGVKEEKIPYYKELHAACWPGVLAKIKECNIQNYSIYLHQLDDGQYYLFSYFEYAGTDFEADMKKMAADEETQRWWKETDPCQFPVKHRKEGEAWASMEEVFHCE